MMSTMHKHCAEGTKQSQKVTSEKRLFSMQVARAGDPPLSFPKVSKKNINPFHMSRVQTHNFVQIQFIQTPSNQHLYEKQMPVLQFTTFLITTIFIENVSMLKSNPNPKNSNRQPKSKHT